MSALAAAVRIRGGFALPKCRRNSFADNRMRPGPIHPRFPDGRDPSMQVVPAVTAILPVRAPQGPDSPGKEPEFPGAALFWRQKTRLGRMQQA